MRWFHTGGIFAALGEHTPDVVEAAMSGARRHGTVVSFDLNYRPSLWNAFGGPARAREVNRRLVAQVDVLIGNEEDFTAALGFEVPGVDERLVDLDVAGFEAMIDEVVAAFPNLAVVATTLRAVRSATRNDWGADRLGGRPAPPGHAPARPRDPRPGRRRRQLRLGPDLRAAAGHGRRRRRSSTAPRTARLR